MEEKGIADQSTEEPRRLTRLEQARLEVLKSFGHVDFASLMQSTKKISLKSKLNLSKKEDAEENKDCLKVTRRKSTRRLSLQRRKTHTRQRLTKTELAKIESLKSFQNHNLADVTNSSKRIVSRFLNKPAKKCAKSTTDAGELSENSISVTSSKKNSDKLTNKQEQSQTASSEKLELTWDKKIQDLLETNAKVLKTAKDLDS